MEGIIQHSKADGTYCWVEIPDIGGGAARVYLLSGSTRPPTPRPGDFAYDLTNITLEVYLKSSWRGFTIRDIVSRLWHPLANKSVASITPIGLPCWVPAEDHDEECDFKTVEELLRVLPQKLNPAKIKVSERPKRRRENSENDGTEGQAIPERNVSGRSKRPRLLKESKKKKEDKIESRFVDSSTGIPQGTPRIRWKAGFETYMPFSGIGKKEDFEGLVVKELANRPSLEASSSGSEQSSDGKMVVEIRLDEFLRTPENEKSKDEEDRWNLLVETIRNHMSNSTSVVIRGWTPSLRLRFSRASMALQFGNLGMRVQWNDGSVIAANRDKRELDPYHRITTMSEFIDLLEDTTVCGNFLDGKDMCAETPMWSRPLLESSIAWEQTLHLRFTKQASTAKDRNPEVVIEQAPPEVIRSETWSSQGWRLVTHPGFVTLPHHDCCGMGTYVIGNVGAKIWAVMRPKREACPTSIKAFKKSLAKASEWHRDGFSNAEIATVCLEEGDVMFQPPGVLHAVYTPVPSIFSGGYFYSYETMHLTRAVLSMNTLEQKDSLTNDHRTGFLRTLCRMVIALRYRSEPRKIGKRSLLSLLLIVLDTKNPEKTSSKMKNKLADEERGELAFAEKCAYSLLKWMDLKKEDAEKFVDSKGTYYSSGEEQVEIPALEDRDPFADIIFPQMNGVV